MAKPCLRTTGRERTGHVRRRSETGRRRGAGAILPFGEFGNNQSFNANFTVAAYRAPEFQVNVTPKDKEIVRGQVTSATVEVSYFFGGGVANRPVQWNVLAEDLQLYAAVGRQLSLDATPTIRGAASIAGGIALCAAAATHPQRIRHDRCARQPHDRDSGDLMQNGAPISHSVQLIVEATVTGTDNQVISGRGSIIRHSGDFYVGVQTRAYVGEENKPSTIDLIAVDWAGERLADKSIEVTVVRRDYVNNFVAEGLWRRHVEVRAEGCAGLQHDGDDQRQRRSDVSLHAAASRLVQDHGQVRRWRRRARFGPRCSSG